MSLSTSSTQSTNQNNYPVSQIDLLLTAQLAVAWAGEGGEEPRLSWWKSDLVSEFGGEDLFQRLMPNTWEWAVFQSVREAACRKDEELRKKTHNPDEIISLYRLGFELDELVNERLQDLKRAGISPRKALPGLSDVLCEKWDSKSFSDWIQGHGESKFKATPAGREIKGTQPGLDQIVKKLVAALLPLAKNYPLPHFMRCE